MNQRIPMVITLFGDGILLSGMKTEYTYLHIKAGMASEEGKYRLAADYYERAACIADILKAPIQAQQMKDYAQREREKESKENRVSFVFSK